MVNVYGPTETTVWSAAGRIRPAPAPVEVGPPIAGTRLLVLDDALRPVPPGVVGEVCIGGAGMTRGYHGRPGLTAERFVPDPYGPPGSRLYRTGDLARWRPDGKVDFLGRLDHQVKLRGFRIELGEIEAALAAHPQVKEATVLLREGRLVAYLSPAAADAWPVESELRAFLLTSLPDYMVPAAFVVLDRLPRNPAGKVDRPALPMPGATAFDRPAFVAGSPLRELPAIRGEGGFGQFDPRGPQRLFGHQPTDRREGRGSAVCRALAGLVCPAAG
jgi:acyl-coenzyme A synthetase/AMP-(fatty) acid ligase